jgi:phosphohistidine swiveling domain-containing protein
VPTFKDADEAVEDYLKHRALEEVGHSVSKRKGESLLPDDWEFYFHAAREGFLSGHDDFPLKEKGAELLEQLLKMRDAFDQDDYELGQDGVDAFDDDGICRKDKLKDDFLMASLCLFYRARILAKAEVQGGFMTLRVGKGEDAYDLRVPRAPFLSWSQRGAHRALADMQHWTPVCPLGMKMMADDPMHSDWWIGAGLNPGAAYEPRHPVNEAAWKFSSNLAYTEGRQCIRLAGKGRVTGAVVFPQVGEPVPQGTIAVVPNAGVDYELALMSACRKEGGAVIAAVGGKLAHLATVSREIGARLVVVDEAMTRFMEGDIVTLNLDDGHVTIHGKNSPFDDNE